MRITRGGLLKKTDADGTYEPLLIPAWAAATDYVINQVVVYQGTYYRANATFTSTSTFDPTKWNSLGTDVSAIIWGEGTRKPNFPNGIFSRGPTDVDRITPKTLGDTRAGLIDWIHGGSQYLIHFTLGVGTDANSACIAIGTDSGVTGGRGMLISCKSAADGLAIKQNSTATGRGFYGSQSSASGVLVSLEGDLSGGKPLIRCIANVAMTTNDILQDWYYRDASTNGEAGRVQADTGILDWRRNVQIADRSDGTTSSWLDVRGNIASASAVVHHHLIRSDSHEMYSYSGTSGQWWPYKFYASGSAAGIAVGSGVTTTVGTFGTVQTCITFRAGPKLSFFGATAITQPTRAGQLTDSSGGASGGSTIAAIPASAGDATGADLTTTRNAIATLAARLNSIEAKLSAAGGGLGLTA